MEQIIYQPGTQSAPVMIAADESTLVDEAILVNQNPELY